MLDNLVAHNLFKDGNYRSWVTLPHDIATEIETQGMDRTEICARIYRIMHDYDLIDLDKLDFHANYQDYGLDSLEWTAIITSIEQEFHTVFPDTFYEHLTNLNQIVEILQKHKFAY